MDDCDGDIDVNLERPVTSDKCTDTDDESDDGEIEADDQDCQPSSKRLKID